MAHRPKPQERVNLTPIGALKYSNPDEWVTVVREAMRVAKGHPPVAAEALGVSARQMFRWLEDPRFADLERAPRGHHID